MRLLVIYNPNARLAHGCPPRLLEQELRRYGVEVELVTAAEQAAARAAAADALKQAFDRVVTAGGDGTVSAVIDVLANTQMPLAVIPLGTGNVLAQESGLRPGRWREACAVAARGRRVARIDLGRAGDRYFATMFGAGLDAQVVADISLLQKRNYGRWAFVRQLFSTLPHYQPPRFSLTADGVPITVRTWLAAVCNTRRYAWRLHFAPHARPDDGLLDLCIFPLTSRARLVAQGSVTFLLQRPALWKVHCKQFQRLLVESDPPVCWQADGELGGQTPVEIEAVPLALSVVVANRPCALLGISRRGPDRGPEHQ